MKTAMSSTEQIRDLQNQIELEVEAHKKTKIKLQMREHENHAITQSRSYRVARIIASSVQFLRWLLSLLKSLNPKRMAMIYANKKQVKRAYALPDFVEAFGMQKSADIAVVLHLYYTEMLPFFIDKLKALNNFSYDLYITIPEHGKSELSKLQAQLPNARIAVVPNCGRDVLPFIQVVKQIGKFGYTSVLKLHSKKSPHRTDGSEWRDKITDSLLPMKSGAVPSIINTLNDKDTAIIGPEGEYVSMLVNLSATAHHIQRITRIVCGEKSVKHLMRYTDEYGFFGGTMFWARFDALMPIVNAISIQDFEPEFGQVDSTLAHGLERMFNVIPELQHKNMFEIKKGEVVKRDYETANIPAWAEFSIERARAAHDTDSKSA